VKLTLLAILLALITGLCFGYYFMPEKTTYLSKPDIQIQELKITETQIVKQPEYITKYIHELKEFGSYDHLKTWLSEIKREALYAREYGWDCVDYSRWLIQRAFDDGYYMELWAYSEKDYTDYFGEMWADWEDDRHQVAVTIIDETVYMVDGQTLNIYWSREFYYDYFMWLNEPELAEKYYGVYPKED